MGYAQPSSLFSEIFPTQKDPDNPGHYLCRFCGKPTTETRRQYYCSDECYNLCQRAVSWVSTRRVVWTRDEKKCTLCGDPVKLYDSQWYSEGEGTIAEIHHMLPVRDLWRLAWDVIKGIPLEELHWRKSCWDHFEDEKQMEQTAMLRAFAIVYTILYLDINNLKTLCTKCHDVVHSADYRNQEHVNPFDVAPTYWANFWRWAKLDRVTKSLDDFFK